MVFVGIRLHSPGHRRYYAPSLYKSSSTIFSSAFWNNATTLRVTIVIIRGPVRSASLPLASEKTNFNENKF